MELAGIVMLFAFPVGPVALGAWAWWRSRGSGDQGSAQRLALWPGALNASLYLALAFNAVYFVQELFLAWPKSRLPGVEAVVYHNNHGWRGDHPEVLVYQGTGALAIVVLGALLTTLGVLARGRLRGLHAALWWTACMALGLGLPQVLVAALHPGNDVSQAFEALELSRAAIDLLAVVSAAGVAAFGIYFARPLLATAPAAALATARGRVVYALRFAVLPLLAGSVIAWPNRAPPIEHLTMPFFSGLFVLSWTLAAVALTPPPPPAGDRLHRRVDGILIAVSLVVLALFRLVLARGVWV